MVPDYTFVGLRNYATLFSLHRFRVGVKNNIIFTALFIPSSILLGFFLAFCLTKGKFELLSECFLFPHFLS